MSHRLHRRQHPELPLDCMLLRLMKVVSSCLGQKRWRCPVSGCWLCMNVMGALRYHLLPCTSIKHFAKLLSEHMSRHKGAC